MSSKYKATGCARFFLVLIILAPIAYLGASYYNGEDGIENVKNFLGIDNSHSDSEPSTFEKKEKDVVNPAENENDDTSAKQSVPVEKEEAKSNEQKERIDELT